MLPRDGPRRRDFDAPTRGPVELDETVHNFMAGLGDPPVACACDEVGLRDGAQVVFDEFFFVMSSSPPLVLMMGFAMVSKSLIRSFSTTPAPPSKRGQRAINLIAKSEALFV
mgnify:CR=1 FL=1